MFRLSRWLSQGNVFVLFFDLVQHVAPLFCSGHWHNYLLQLGQAVGASVQSIFLRCLCTQFKATHIITLNKTVKNKPKCSIECCNLAHYDECLFVKPRSYDKAV